MDIDEKLKLQYDKFFIKINETLPLEQWSSNHILGYFCKKYKEHYKSDLQFKFDKSPSQCFELKIIGRLKLAISSDPKILKDYIDYFFENRVKKAKKKLAITAMVAEFIMTDFKSQYQIGSAKSENISRSTQLPNTILSVMIRNKLPVKTYGDLVFLINSKLHQDIVDQLNIDADDLKTRVV